MKTKKVAFLGLSISLSMILSFVESQSPALVAIPGIKVGLPNIAIVFLLYKFGWREAVIVNIVRVILSGMLFGNPISIIYSLCGATLSLLGMIILKKTNWFSPVAVSVVGGVLHNVGQILIAIFVTETAQLLYYLPVLLFSGTVAGVVIGIIAGLLVQKLSKLKF